MNITLRDRWLAACLSAFLSTLAHAELERVTVIKDESGEITTHERPIKEHESEKSEDSGFVETVLRAFLGALFTGPSNDETVVAPAKTDLPANRSARAVRVEAGYAYSRIFNTLGSYFSSPSFSQVHWDDTLKLRSQAAETTLLYGVEDFLFLGLNAGGFTGSSSGNAQNQNSVYVSENITHSGGWGVGLVRIYPVSWLSIDGSLGALGYSLHTEAHTNAPTYIYQGFDGGHVVGLAGLGARLETPWQSPLKIYVGGRYWWNCGDSRPTIETGVAQFETGLTWKFNLD